LLSPPWPPARAAAAAAGEQAGGTSITGTRKRLDDALDEAVPNSATPKRDKRLRSTEDIFACMRLDG